MVGEVVVEGTVRGEVAGGAVPGLTWEPVAWLEAVVGLSAAQAPRTMIGSRPESNIKIRLMVPPGCSSSA